MPGQSVPCYGRHRGHYRTVSAERTDRAAVQRAVTNVLNALPPPVMAPQPVVPRTVAELNAARLAAARKIRMGIASP